MEYVTTQIIKQVCEELATGEVSLLDSHTILKAQAKEYIRESQFHQIVKPEPVFLF